MMRKKILAINNKGFTLAELIVSIAIFALLSGSVMAIFLFSWKSRGIIWEQLQTQNEGRKVVNDFINEIRTASYSNVGAYPISVAATGTITFYSDADKDNLRERIRYFLTASRMLRKGVLIPSGDPPGYVAGNEVFYDVAHDVSNGTTSIFDYYDGNYTGVGNPMSAPINITNIRVIRIRLKLDEDPFLTPTPFYIESKAMMRSFKSN